MVKRLVLLVALAAFCTPALADATPVRGTVARAPRATAATALKGAARRTTWVVLHNPLVNLPRRLFAATGLVAVTGTAHVIFGTGTLFGGDVDRALEIWTSTLGAMWNAMRFGWDNAAAQLDVELAHELARRLQRRLELTTTGPLSPPDGAANHVRWVLEMRAADLAHWTGFDYLSGALHPNPGWRDARSVHARLRSYLAESR
jgi:hypothetical protein